MAHSKLRVAILLLLALAVPLAPAQLGPLSDPSRAPQAKTQEEFDQYLQITTESDPRQVIQRADAFVHAFPDSQFAGVAFQYQMHAYQQTGQFDELLAAGRKALAANPDNLNTLLTLAPAAANIAMQRPDRVPLLTQARTWANNALAAIDRTQAPRQLPLAQWQAEKSRMQAEAHETLGVVALDESDVGTAVHEFQTAIALQPSPDGAQFLRLGLAFLDAGNKEEAARNLRRAAELGPEPVRTLALNQIKILGTGVGK
jgi:tetratricopeptide (TPR) repeat protein